ncbi:MAG: hypothetical protein HKN79_12515 [Flavobacteriales bacterium]|nr:hypothetical protein [Flavobacteriales bacterium]
MLTIYSDNISPRLSYIAKVLFEDLLDCPVILTSDRSGLQGTSALNYSHETIDGIPYIRPHSLLFEQGVRSIGQSFDDAGKLFPVDSDLVDQDILAASFFLLTRYEEYLHPDRDRYGRAKASDSLLFKAGLIERPVVDEWVIQLYQALRHRFASLPPIQREFEVLPTFDIDVAYCYRGRGFWRRWRSSLKDLFTLKWERWKERRRVLNGEQADNFDSYSYQQRICAQSGSKCKHFFLLGNYGPLDKNLSHRQPILRTLIQDISSWSDVGIHPSMRSHEKERILKKEIGRLEKITGQKTTRSRQHYLKVELPETYRRLIRQGIEEDYSMGYADHIGFRAGTCTAFRWYDLLSEESTPLYVVPTHIMDSSLKDYMGLDRESATERVLQLRESVQAVNGTLVVLWHNHSAARQGEWVGWRSVLESALFG